ncbi:MAG: hypothetical protein ACLFRL_08350 [Desulfohalobiaceae bacterium]
MADHSSPQHCPGFEQFKHLSTFSCNCPKCGEEKEIFSDEFDKAHTCDKCGEPLDFTECSLEGAGGKKDHR